jgi:hypothetical protein
MPETMGGSTGRRFGNDRKSDARTAARPQEGDVPRNYREYEGDVWYEVWRNGGNPDNVDPDRVRDYYDDGYGAEAAARQEQNRTQRIRHEQWEDDSGPDAEGVTT